MRGRAWFLGLALGFVAGSHAATEPDAPRTAEQIEEALRPAYAEKSEAKRGAKLRKVVDTLRVDEMPAAAEVAGRAPVAPKGNIRKFLYSEIFSRWALRSDPKTVLTIAEKIDDPSGRNGAVSRVLNRWALTDGPAAFAYASQLPPGLRRDAVMTNVAGTWAENDPDAVVRMVTEASPGTLPAPVVKIVLGRLKEIDPGRALDLWLRAAASTSTDLPSMVDSLRQIFWRYGQFDPVAAGTRAATLARMDWRETAFNELAASWAGTDPQSALAWFSGRKILTPERAAALYENWARREPALAARASLELAPELQPTVWPVVGRAWARSDSAAMMAWARTLPSVDGVIEMMTSAVFDASSSKPAWAAAEVLKLPEGDRRRGVMQAVARAWTLSDPKAASAWIDALTSEADRAAVQPVFVEYLARSDVKAAAAAAGTLRPGPVRDAALNAVVSAWAQQDPAAGVDWLQSLPEADLFGNAGHYAELWMRRDPDAALAWVKTLPVGRTRDWVIVRVCDEYPAGQAPTGMELAATVGDAEWRIQALVAIARKWFRDDVSEAAMWVVKSALSDEDKRRVLAAAAPG